VDAWGEEMIKKDVEFIKRRNEKAEMQGTGKKVDYMPVVLPGGSVSFSIPSLWCYL
jgi:hypothetical protein